MATDPPSFFISSARRLGFSVLLGLLLAFSLGRYLLQVYHSKGEPLLNAKAVLPKQSKTAGREITAIEINEADSAAFEALPFIGPKTSRRIIHYREKIGGFRSLADFRRVYGMDTLYPKIARYVYLDSTILPKKPVHLYGQPAKVKPLSPQQDLNQITENQLLAAHLVPEPLAKRIIHYRDARKGFKTIGDLKQVYGLHDDQYALLAESFFVNEAATVKPKLTVHEPVELNLADSATLEALPWLGPTLTHRILTYRERLGFYTSIGQLREVYGLSDSAFVHVSPLLTLNTPISEYLKLPLNYADENTLARHPYIGRSLARRLVNYRTQHGRYHGLADLEALYGVEKDQLAKISPYLSFR